MADCRFRIDQGQPQLWNPLTGKISILSDVRHAKSRTGARLRFEPYQSFFVVFGNATTQLPGNDAGKRGDSEVTFLAPIPGPWRVSFATDPNSPAADARKEVTFAKLEDWTKRAEPELKYYSGIALYNTEFDIPTSIDPTADSIVLDLGEVHCLARVRLNGHDLGIVWCAPWRVEVTGALQARGNRLQIEVANLWPNRLIGDAGLPAEQRVAWTTWNPYRKDAPLLPSGLLGPVRLGKR